MSTSPRGVTPSQLLRRLSTALTTDLSEGADLLEITFALVLRNLLKNFRQYGGKAYPFLKVVVPYAVLLAGVYQTILRATFVSNALKAMVSLITDPLTANVTVPANHALNMDVLHYLTKRGLLRKPRSLVLSNSPAVPTYDDGDDGDYSIAPLETSTKPTQLSYIPDFGKHMFWFKGSLMSMERKDPSRRTKASGSDFEVSVGWGSDPPGLASITLECFPTLCGISPIVEFLDHVSGFANPPKENTTTVYRPADGNTRRYNGATWSVGITRPSRSLESVALEAKIKDALVKEVGDYLTIEHQRFCANRGYPYRLGMLLYGPPCTGKTSFSVALAGHFALNIYILSLSNKSLTDQELEIVFAALPDRCIVLLEDVDSSGVMRELTRAEKKELWDKNENNEGSLYTDFEHFATENKSLLTLSGLLNCLDGPMSKDGRIVCMTTNAPDSFDPALIRAGRCDHRVHFGYVSEEICIQLFTHLYTKRPDELVGDETSASEQYDIASLAREFASKIPVDSMISSAEVQGFLMKYRRHPQAAVDGAEEFARETMEIKDQGKNVASFMNEVGSGVKTE